MSAVEDHIARLQAMKPKEGGWMTPEFQLAAVNFCAAHMDDIEAAWEATQQATGEGVVRRAVYDWIRDDAPLNQKMTTTPALAQKLIDRILATQQAVSPPEDQGSSADADTHRNAADGGSSNEGGES